LSQIDEHVKELEDKIKKLEGQVEDYQAIIAANSASKSWQDMLRTEVIRMLIDNDSEIKNVGRDAEYTLIKTALEFNCNRRQETAIILGYGRNTITKKAAEFNLKF
jgi:two-component system nitrogen regulation response regulator GlnG